MRERSIASHFVRAALHGAMQRGQDHAALLRAAGIPPALYDEPRARVAPEQFSRLIQLLWEALDDEYLGLAQLPSRRGSFAMMCHAIIHCCSLGSALRRGLLFYSLFPGLPPIRLHLENEQVRLIVDDSAALDDPEHFLVESLLVIWHRLASWLIGQRIRLEEATFRYPAPAHHAEYHLLYACPQRFAANSTGLLFSARYLDMPLLQDERTLKQFLLHSPADLLARPDGGTSLGSRVRRLLGRDCRQWVELDQAARQLHISPQTLRRHLREEGSSFQALKDQLRRDLAIYQLGQTQTSIREIAEQLGFSEPSAFHRAFKKWTGLPPGAYRAQQS